MSASLTRFWQDRTAREKAIIAIGGALLAFALAYAYAWLPVARSRERLMSELPRLRAQAQQIRIDAEEVGRLRGPANIAPRDIKVALTAASATLARDATVTPEPDGRVRVAFASVRADDWVAWVSALALEQGIRIVEVRVDTLETAGTVRVNSTFSAGLSR